MKKITQRIASLLVSAIVIVSSILAGMPGKAVNASEAESVFLTPASKDDVQEVAADDAAACVTWIWFAGGSDYRTYRTAYYGSFEDAAFMAGISDYQENLTDQEKDVFVSYHTSNIMIFDDVTITNELVMNSVTPVCLDLNGHTVTVTSTGSITGRCGEDPTEIIVDSMVPGTFNNAGVISVNIGTVTGDTFDLSGEISNAFSVDGGIINITGGSVNFGGRMINNGGDADIEATITGDARISRMTYVCYLDNEGNIAQGMHDIMLTLEGGYYDVDPRTYKQGSMGRDPFDQSSYVNLDENEIQAYNGQDDWAADPVVYPWRIVHEDTPAQVTESGTWGTCPWTIDSKGTLTVYPGEGADRTNYSSPWGAYSDTVKKAVFASDESGNKVVAPADSDYLLYMMKKMTSADLRGLDTSNVTSMQNAFAHCSKLRSVDVTGLNMSNVKNIAAFFSACSNLALLKGFEGLDLSSVNTLFSVFTDCTSIKAIDLTCLGEADITQSAGSAFEGCSSVVMINLAEIKISQLYTTGNMFKGCTGLQTIYVGNNWNTESVGSSSGMFSGCTSLTGGAGTVFNGSYTDKTYARVDGGPESATPGYFTHKQADTRTSIQTATVTLSATSFIYSGAVQKPTVTSVKLGNELLTADTDYTFSYSNADSKDVGTYTVTVTGKGNYKGRATRSYEIREASVEPVKYAVVVNNGDGDGEYAEGATVTIKADAPAEGKEFDKWTTADGVRFANESADTTTFIMPGKAVTVTATYKDKQKEEEFTVTVVGGSGSGSYKADATVTIKANSPADGKVFSKWTSADGVEFSDAAKEETTFKMPAKAVTVTATYVDKPATDAKSHRIVVADGTTAKNSAGVEVKAAKENETISIAWTAKDKYQFVNWKLTGAMPANAAAANTTFVMGSQDVMVDYVEQIATQNEVIEPEGFEVPPEEKSVKVSKLEFENSKLTIQRNTPYVANRAKPVYTGEGEAPAVHYVTENKDIVAVDQTGNFYPMGQGSAKVTAYCGNKKKTCKVTVVSYTSDISILDEENKDVTDGEMSIAGGQKAFMTIVFNPYDSTDSRKVTWKSDSTDITVSKSGIVSVRQITSETTAVITATVNVTDPSNGGKIQISRKVTVKGVPGNVEKAASNDKTHTLSTTSSKNMVTTEGSNTKEIQIRIIGKKKVSEGEFEISGVSSTNTDVVDVGILSSPQFLGKYQNYKLPLTAKKPGTAYIIVKSRAIGAEEGSYNVQRCKISVKTPAQAIRVESGSLNVADSGSNKTVTMRKGAKGTLEIGLDPEYSTDIGIIKVKGSGGVSYKNGIITATKVTKSGKPAKLKVTCGKKKQIVYVTVTK